MFLLKIHPQSVSMVALDGYRLAVSTEKMNSGQENHFIISAKIINEISKIIAEDGDAEDSGNLPVEKRKLHSGSIRPRSCCASWKENTSSIEISCRLRGQDVISFIGRAILQESIERASLLAREGKNNLIKMTIKNNLLTITSRSEEGNVKEEIIMEKDRRRSGNRIQFKICDRCIESDR